MKLFNSKEDSLYLTKTQWAKLFIACSVLVLLLYIGAMIASLCGSDYFILNYQNAHMEQIESFLRTYQIMPILNFVFSTIEFFIVVSFITKRFVKWYYPLTFYAVAIILAIAFSQLSSTPFYQIYPFLFYFAIPIIEQVKDNKKSLYNEKFSFKKYAFCILRLVIAMAVTFILQFMIYVIKTGNFSVSNHIQSLSKAFIYAIEYDIALSVILFTMLLVYREKGDSKLWVNYHNPGGSSLTSKKQSQKSLLKKNLTKTQRNKIRLLYARFYLTQLGAFLLLMVLPFLLGKVIEFLVMYLSFAVSRYLLGFKYSLHYKKETTCITVGVVVFGILSLAVPFFYIVLIIAIAFGIGLAILLHLSYKYKGMWLFTQVAKPDKFALLYVFFDGDLSEYHVKKMCKFKGLTPEETELIGEYVEGHKISYIAYKHNYSQRMMIYKLDEAIDKLIK